MSSPQWNIGTDHLEGVQLLFDLLGKHRRQAIAGSNLAASVIFSTWPRVVELNTRAKCSVALETAMRGTWNTLGVSSEPQGRHKIILSTDCD